MGAFSNILDAAEQQIISEVREAIREEVTKTLLEEFNTLVQQKTNEVISQMCFKIHSNKEPFRLIEDLNIYITWLNAKEGKKTYRTVSTIEEVIE